MSSTTTTTVTSESEELLGSYKKNEMIRLMAITQEPIRGVWLLPQFRGTAGSRVFWKVIASMVWTTAITLLWYFGFKLPNLPVDAHNLAGSALALLLVFRTGSASARFWEGRIQFDMVCFGSIQLAIRLAIVDGMTKHRYGELCNILLAFALSIKARLHHSIVGITNDSTNREAVGVAFEDEEVDTHHVFGELKSCIGETHFHDISTHTNPPMYICFLANKLVQAASNEHEQSEIAKKFINLMNHQTALEKVATSPMPFAYAVMLTQLLVVYLVTLPFILVQTWHWVTIVVVAFMSFALLGINDIADEIEDPFGDDINDLPLDDLCERLARNLHFLTQIFDQQEDHQRATSHK